MPLYSEPKKRVVSSWNKLVFSVLQLQSFCIALDQWFQLLQPWETLFPKMVTWVLLVCNMTLVKVVIIVVCASEG